MFTHEMIKSFNQLEMDVYNYIIGNEEKVVYMKVRELAEEVHVSTTTILRFCKKVGCEGYSEFRLKLKQEVNSKEQKKINMDLTAVKDFFERVQTQAFAENIQEAVKLLTKASSIIFVGVGNSSIIGKYGARYFNNVGWFSFAIDDPFTPVFRGKGEREYKKDENYDLTSQMAVVFILELIGRELEGVHNDTDDLFQNDMEDLFH